MPAEYYLNAARRARYHVQGTVVQRTDAGWARVRVDRLFRGDRDLAVGDEVIFCVHVAWPSQRIPPAETLWTSIATWRRTEHVEAFLNGEPPRCALAGDQWIRLPALTRGPLMKLDRLNHAAADAGDRAEEVAVEAFVQRELARLREARPVLCAADLVGQFPGFSPDPSRQAWGASYGAWADPTAFDEAFLPARVPIEGSYGYSDASKSVYIGSTFAALARDPEAAGAFEWQRRHAQGWVKPGLMTVFDLDRSYSLVARSDLWQWGDQSSSFLIRLREQTIGNVFLAAARSALLLYVVAGIAFERPAEINAALGPVLERVDSYLLQR